MSDDKLITGGLRERLKVARLWLSEYRAKELLAECDNIDVIFMESMVNEEYETQYAAVVAMECETCHDEGTFKSWGYFTCSNCQVVIPVEAVREAPSIGKVVPISFCPNCGRKLADE